MIPLTITARLQQGVVLDTRYGTALDGLLASVIRDRAKAAAGVPGSLYDGGLATPTPATVELPLAICPGQPLPDHEQTPALNEADLIDPDPSHLPALLDDLDAVWGHWHWAATTALPAQRDGDYDVHHIITRVPERLAENHATRLPATLSPSSGRFRMRRLPVPTTPTTHLTWRAVGDPDRIRDLLTDVTTIGGRRRTGEGTVLSWDVTPAQTSTPRDQWAHGHHHLDGTLGRPVPDHCLHRTTPIPSSVAGRVGIRPPYWHQATQHDLHLPAPLAEV